MEGEIKIKAKKKKKLNELSKILGDLGFSRMDFSRDKIVVEKYKDTEKPDYRIIFDHDSITFVHSVPENKKSKIAEFEFLPLFLNTLAIVTDFYELDSKDIINYVQKIWSELGKTMDKDVIEISSELNEIKARYFELQKKYSDLLRSSEENARILIECESKRDELQKRVDQLEKISDQTLKEELYSWIKLHGGSIDIIQFCKSYNIVTARAEEGIALLVKEGYIRKRSE